MDQLEEILALRKKDLADTMERVKTRDLEDLLKSVAAPIPFLPAVTKKGTISIIAEMKRKSPSAGMIRENFVVADIARAYEKGGASALSVLTEPVKFGGSLGDMAKARQASTLPILRKDFIFDDYQILEARVNRADAVLLIADMLSPAKLKELMAACAYYEVEPLVEVFTPEIVNAVVKTGAKLIGINTRNLRTLQMVPENVTLIARSIPDDRFIVAESGIKTAADIKALKKLPVSTALIGESLLKQPNLETAMRALADAAR